MNSSPMIWWVVATAMGLALGFVGALQTGMLIEFGFNWRMHWRWIEQPPDQNASEYVSTLLSMLAGGAILGFAQAFVLPGHSIPLNRWILATVTGFGVAAIIIDWPLIALGVLGAIPGPVEPIIVTVGGGSFAGVLQYLSLRRKGIFTRRWLLLWVGGLLAGIVPTAFVMIVLESLGMAPSWPLEVFLSGFIIGGVAAWISGRALFAALPETRSSIA
ncbi:MAG TPA: hypothetical protein VF190_05165 [Rhodothermales bacterium]